MTNLEPIASHRLHGGWQRQYKHQSAVLNCTMQFSVYLPPQAEHQALPVLYWLSGLTCTDENFSQKSAAQRAAAEHGIILIIPDTSPRGDDVADDDAYDLGKGAGFYLNATQAPWSAHYRMADYVVDELPALITQAFNTNGRASISGHSMGGHGALTLAIKHPQNYCSVSAFAPIVSPTTCPWGQKAFNAYLGDDQAQWADYDACLLLKKHGLNLPVKIDQGLADNFLDSQQLTKPFEQQCQQQRVAADIQYHDGYDHSYYFISSFIDAHIAFHAQALHKQG